jgi:hypothetical protein
MVTFFNLSIATILFCITPISNDSPGYGYATFGVVLLKWHTANALLYTLAIMNAICGFVGIVEWVMGT